MSNSTNLEAFGPDGELRMIVETPSGPAVKLKYEPKLKTFTVLKPEGVLHANQGVLAQSSGDLGLEPRGEGAFRRFLRFRRRTQSPYRCLDRQL